jgi:DNA-binding transcriptional regulator PaaX
MLWLNGGLLVEVIWLVGLAKLCIDFGSEETTVKTNLSEINTTI